MSKVTSLEGKVPKQPLRQVTSVERSDLFPAGRMERYNPDQLASRKGGLQLYSKMMLDEQVKAVVDFKRASIIGRGYTFEFCESELPREEQNARRQVMEQIVARMKGSFADSLRAVLRGMITGYSLTEFVTDRITIAGKTYVGVNSLIARDVESFVFHTDPYGELVKFVQLVGGKETELDYSRFIHYVQSPEDDPYYGASELKAAYRAWFMKDTLLKFWAQYLERMAGGFLAIKLGASGITVGSPDYTALQSVLANLRGSMGVLLPDGVEAELATPTTTDAYEKAILFHDLSIAKALLIPNLLGLSNSGQTGAYAQSQTQLEVYFMTIAADSARLEQCLNDQLFKPIAAQNWQDGEFPLFKFKNASAEHTKWVVDTWTTLVDANTVVTTESDEVYLRKLLTMPKRDPEEDEPLVTPAQEREQENIDKDREAGKEDEDDAPAKKAFAFDPDQPRDENGMWSESGALGRTMTGAEQYAASAEGELLLPRGTKFKVVSVDKGARHAVVEVVSTKMVDDGEVKTFAQVIQHAARRVDFAVIAQRSLALETTATQDVARLAARATRRAIDAERLTELLDADTKDIGELKLDSTDVGKIKAAYRSMLERSWAVGLTQAMDETGKFRKLRYTADESTVKFADLRGKAADYFDSNAFRMAGNLTDGMRSIIQQELLKGVRGSIRPDEVAATIYERLIRKGFTTLEAMQIEESRAEVRALAEALLADALDVANVPAYLNTLARTNTFEALNEARYAEFTSPAVADFVEGLEYSAILDDRTTDICTEMDGHVHAVGSAVWERYRPPLHYNCRSLLIPITSLDGWDGVESDDPKVEPQDGF